MCKLYCSKEHSSCSCYEKDMNLTIEIRQIKRGSVLQASIPTNEIVYVLKGTMLLTLESDRNFNVPESHMCLLTKGQKVSAYSLSENVEVLVIRFYDKIQFCDSNRIEDLLQHADKQGWTKAYPHPEYFTLKVDKILNIYMESLALCYHRGIRCMHYNNYKIKELFHILLAFYTEESLYYFFHQIVSADLEFSQQVYDKYNSFNNVSELASAMNYSTSGFEKKFRRVFDESPYRWIKKRKAYQIRHQICAGKLNFKEISDQFGFASMSDFCKFVKRELGQTPLEIRKGKR